MRPQYPKAQDAIIHGLGPNSPITTPQYQMANLRAPHFSYKFEIADQIASQHGRRAAGSTLPASTACRRNQLHRPIHTARAWHTRTTNCRNVPSNNHNRVPFKLPARSNLPERCRQIQFPDQSHEHNPIERSSEVNASQLQCTVLPENVIAMQPPTCNPCCARDIKIAEAEPKTTKRRNKSTPED